jgi:glycosyltransferase involved in cell wall biosynthesis
MEDCQIMLPKVSVIIPALNCETFIVTAVNSIERQQYINIEIIIVDDGSADKTKEIIMQLCKTNPQIIFSQNSRKKGPSGARNTGLLMASGDYISFLDADDIWLPIHLKYAIKFMEEHHDIDVVFYNFNVMDYSTQEILFNWFEEKNFTKSIETENIKGGYKLICDDMFNALLDESFMHLQSMIIRRQSCGNILFNENIIYSEDRDFAIRLFSEAKAQFAFKNVITGIYCRHQNSITYGNIDNSIVTVNDHIILFKDYLNKYELNKSLKAKIKHILYKRYLTNSYNYRNNLSFSKSLYCILNSLKYHLSFDQMVELSKLILEVFCSKIAQKHRTRGQTL